MLFYSNKGDLIRKSNDQLHSIFNHSYTHGYEYVFVLHMTKYYIIKFGLYTCQYDQSNFYLQIHHAACIALFLHFTFSFSVFFVFFSVQINIKVIIKFRKKKWNNSHKTFVSAINVCALVISIKRIFAT